jgi:formylglycine-generating enzyme required for sulfatase activity
VEEPAESGVITIPAGEFVMGSDQGDESPAHTILVEAFEIDKFEVTNAAFAQFVEETGYETDAEKNGDPNLWRAYFTEEKAQYPVVKVSWNDADAYCQWAGKRLPTEVEWEKAARGTDEVVYPWGDTWDVARVNSKDSGYRGPVTVGSFPDGASTYGVMDMAGNVWEWTADWYQGYPQTQFTSNYFGETYRVLRGGGWFSEPDLVRTTKRNANSPDAANDDIGFRCAR